MDSINVLKGYGKVNAVDQHLPHPPRPGRRPLLLAIFVTASVLLILVIGLLIAAAVHDLNESSSLASNSAASIRAVCGVTQYPDSCFSSLSSLNCSIRPDPESIFRLSLAVSAKELSNSSLFVKQLKQNSNDVHSNGALGDCEAQLEDAMTQLKESTSAAEAGLGEKVSDIQTWVSAAMTDQETCLDGLEEVGSPLLDEVRAKLQRSKEMMSNSLAIVAHLKDLHEKFEKGMH